VQVNRELHLASAEELRRLIASSVSVTAPDETTPSNIAGLAPEQFSLVQHLLPEIRTQAAVLVPIIVREQGLNLLFTQRATHLRRHAGQISFPGGRIEPTDDSPLAAALRETEEEIGLKRQYVHTVGYLGPHLIFTGYCVTPVVAFVQPSFELRLDASEVAEVFEAPLTHFLNPANHLARDRAVGDVKMRVYDLPFGERRIWGATAGIIMSLYRSLRNI
jgi:8-oxo-dGTP pyrophosphatase MutT (NUDIX family)